MVPKSVCMSPLGILDRLGSLKQYSNNKPTEKTAMCYAHCQDYHFSGPNEPVSGSSKIRSSQTSKEQFRMFRAACLHPKTKLRSITFSVFCCCCVIMRLSFVLVLGFMGPRWLRTSFFKSTGHSYPRRRLGV